MKQVKVTYLTGQEEIFEADYAEVIEGNLHIMKEVYRPGSSPDYKPRFIIPLCHVRKVEL